MSGYEFSGDILCMGSINMDLVMIMSHLPVSGETVATDNYNTYPGGKAANQAVTAAKLGGHVKFFGKLGDDDFSGQLINSLSKSGVDITSILREKNATAGIAMIRVDHKGENSISFTAGANSKLTPQDIKDAHDLFQPGGILLITMEINPETTYEAIRMAKKNDMFIILDPAPAPKEKIPSDIPAMVNVVKPNETEAFWLTGIEVKDSASAQSALKKMSEMGFSLPIITLGDQGVIAFVEDQFIKLDSLPVKVVDSTAAGDVFSGALTSFLAKGDDLYKALRFANAAAALSTTVRGAQTSIPTLTQVESFYRRMGAD